MDNPGEILRLCRLCLVKDQVNIPIFEEQGDIRQTFLKIRSCLPVKVSRDDKLPKKICGGCSNKLDLFYEFWSSTANSEKTLQSWLGQEEEDDKMQEITKPVEALVKEESEALEDGHAHDQSFDEATKDEAEAPPAKRARRTAAVKAQINISHDSDEDEDVDGAEPITKIEDESDDSDGEEKDPSYTEVPGTSADDQAGPSGLGKDGVEAPRRRRSGKFLKIEDDYFVYPQKLQKNLFCSLCQKHFRTQSSFQRHRACHQPTNNNKKQFFPCKYCNETFSSQAQLRNHRKTHKAEVFPEDNPSYKFDSDQELYICDLCSAEFQSLNEVQEHIKGHLPDYRCKECDLEFLSILDLGMHSMEHSEEKKIKCPLCKYVSKGSNIYSFKSHLNYMHFKKFPFYCSECGRGFKQFKLYQDHSNSHTGEKPYVCIVCSKGFSFEKYLVVHQIRNHDATTSSDDVLNQCKTCHKAFKTFEVHQCSARKKQFKKPNSFLCDTCGQGFIEKSKLLKHIRVHKGDLPFECSWCGKKFPQKDYLRTHERVHTGEKPYRCSFCGKSFGFHAPYRVHLRTHTGERPYKCDFCDRGFTTNQGLKLHKKGCPENQLNKMLSEESLRKQDPVCLKYVTVEEDTVVPFLKEEVEVEEEVLKVDAVF
ncbi:zinc finger protein ZFP2-like isoform X11 [Euwallacea similis]|uniref:zinc finger protein ZFP2-like isoform X11 n=1 Tax=Euwallacea similis TaxID=1736056 RepID=UPI00344BAAA7